MIKLRIMQVLENKDIPKEEFFKKIGVSSGNFRGIQAKSPLNSNIEMERLKRHLIACL